MPDGADEILLRYLTLLSKWNHTYNLTAIRDEREMLSHHLLDSLAVLPHLGGLETLADIGSGAGLPGIVLAIARPDIQVTSVESSQKKAAFQQQVKIDLELPNVSIYCGRVEQFGRQNWFDGVISRAFSSLAEFIRLAGGLVKEGGTLLAMKGRFPSEEVAKIPTDWMVADTIRLDVPGLFAERHLIVMKRL
jgi:16S rRNA (guanine527-N7)-methyltransferase